jgi:4-hydroxy-2-oxoheptanedioate aldolase
MMSTGRRGAHMKTNPVLAAKEGGGKTVGIWLSLGNPIAAEILAGMGFDWVLIDMQHATSDWATVSAAVQAVELGGSCALVRVAWNSPELIMRALDLGAAGVVVPMVSKASDALRASEVVRYPPGGKRSFGTIRTFFSSNGQRPVPACIVMIETREGIDNVEAIAKTPGIDAIFTGPVDLAIDMGLPVSMTMHDTVLREIEKTIAACTASGILCGCASLSRQNADDLLSRGVRFLSLGSDLGYLVKAAQEDAAYVASLKSASNAGKAGT